MEESKYHFEKLTPKDDIEIGVYEEAINKAFDEEDIKNVAITGAYGAGKSSVLATYKKEHDEYKFMHISLAHYESTEPKARNEVLEGKILNQLLHQIPAKKIYQTNFKIKKEIESKEIYIQIFTFISLIAGIGYLIKVDSMKMGLLGNLFTIIIVLIETYILIVIAYHVIKFFRSKSILRKLTLQGNEIEIFKDADDSCFDKYLNEILYLFENAGVDAIVFEDIDRFSTNVIFERLSEVNTLVNIRLSQNKKVLRFFYLLRDDVFNSKDRTKFFDYIIPVVPIVDSSNSYDQLITYFKKSRIINKFDSYFLRGVSLYIDDMRLIRNIYNEFLIYYDKLNSIELNCDKMLAIIIYKNLFPKDFSDLQLNKGFVFSLFNKKRDFINDEIKKLEQEINNNQIMIDKIKQEQAVTYRELDAIFADKYLKSWSLGDKTDNQLATFISNNLKGNRLVEYKERKKILEYKLDGKSDNLIGEIQQLKNKIIKTKKFTLSEVITRENIDEIFNVKEVEEGNDSEWSTSIMKSDYFPFLKFVIRNGYINETYPDYMTVFYGVSIKQSDKIFLRSITDKVAKEYTYKLVDPELVVSELEVFSFDEEETLNFDLFTYLMKSKKYDDQLNHFVNHLKNNSKFKFIGEYFENDADACVFVSELNKKWPEAFEEALIKQQLSEMQLFNYSLNSIYFSDKSTLELMNRNNILCEFISNKKDYLNILNPDIDKLAHGFEVLKVCFREIEYETANKDLLEVIYENSLYEINKDNLFMFQNEYLNISDSDILHRNYSIISSQPSSILSEYVNKNIDQYIEVMLEACEQKILDDEIVAIKVINNKEINETNKKLYMSYLETTIVLLSAINNSSYWSQLVEQGIVECSVVNIITYFMKFKLDTTLVDFINKSNGDLDFSKLWGNTDSREIFFTHFAKCNELNNRKYEQIFSSYNLEQEDFECEDIEEDKISILIKLNIIIMNKENLIFMRESYADSLIEFIISNIETYVAIVDNELYNYDELVELLSIDIDETLKIKLLELTDDEISVINSGYSDKVFVHILENNFMSTEMLELFKSFDQQGRMTQLKIYDLAIENIDEVMRNIKVVSSVLKNKLISSDNIESSQKLDVLISMIPGYSEEDIRNRLSEIGLEEYTQIFDYGKRPTFVISAQSKKILEALKAKGIIISYEESTVKKRYYKIKRGQKTKK